MDTSRSLALQPRFRARIPGGAHTYAKGDDQYPEQAPVYVARGKGCHVWDIDENEYIEYGMGLRSVTLGHAFPRVLEAVTNQLQLGTNFVRPSPIELELADTIAALIPTAEMVKFMKDGSSATSAAVRLARAHTGREMVAVCSSDPFYSYDDWFIGTTEMSAGTLPDVAARTVKFDYNDLGTLQALFAQYPQRIACVIMEAERTTQPVDGFLQGVQDACRENGALFVLDEMITGFRWHIGGAQTLYGLEPDISTFGKGLANGFSVSAIVGRRDMLELGGFDHSRRRVFLASTTHGAETHSLAAALATISAYQELGVVETLHERGEQLARGVLDAAREAGVEEFVGVAGRPCNLIYVTRDREGVTSQPFRTLFLQETMKRGLLMPSLVVSYSHTEDDVKETVEKLAEALLVYRAALDDGIDRYLVGRSVRPTFRGYGDGSVTFSTPTRESILVPADG